MEEQLRLLIVEDDENDADLLRLELHRCGFRLTSRRVDTEKDFRDALGTQSWDMIISDFAMPSFDGLRAYDVYKSSNLDIPFIFVSGAIGEERAVEAMRSGARDYFIKGQLARLGVAVRRELNEARNRIARRESEAEAERHQRRLAMAVEASGGAVFESGDDGNTFYSERWTDILGHLKDELPQSGAFWGWVRDRVHADDLPVFERAFAPLTGGAVPQFRSAFRMRHKLGHWVDVEICVKNFGPEPSEAGDHWIGVLRDLTDRRRLEGQLRQSQKMEAIGQLASGIAHDFNNLLTVIYSFTTIAMDEIGPGHKSHDRMAQVFKAAKKAEGLTSQLLAYSRKKPILPRVLSLNDTVHETDRMLRRLLGEDVKVALNLKADLWNVRIDPGAFEQILVNLAVNARDAMPEGGTLTLETDNVRLADEFAVDHGISFVPGDYVAIAISDTGQGMDEAVRSRIFEPFYTTKEIGKGTGLGLSTCYGIIKQADGYIWVYSEVGHGTTFRIYLPRVAGPTETAVPVEEPGELGGSETILVTEDDEVLRKLITLIFSRQGYTVVEAGNGPEAISQYESLRGEIDLLLTDIIMPGMHGRQLVEKLRQKDPSLKVVYMSGYTPTAATHQGVLDPGVVVLQKPFTPQSLCKKIRQELDVRD